MQNAQSIHLFFMALAIALEVAANIFIKQSNGFSRRWVGAAGIGCILLSFTALSQAVKGIELSIAYALWGGAGIVLTTAAGWRFFKQKLNAQGCVGIALIVLGIAVLKQA